MIRTNGQNGQRGRHEICGNHCKASRWVCMFDSKYTDYKVVNTTYGKDIIKEWVDAFKEAGGLKVGGFYYSLIDWHHPRFHHRQNSPVAPRLK